MSQDTNDYADAMGRVLDEAMGGDSLHPRPMTPKERKNLTNYYNQVYSKTLPRSPGLRCIHCGTTYAGLAGPCPKCGKNTAQKLVSLPAASLPPTAEQLAGHIRRRVHFSNNVLAETEWLQIAEIALEHVASQTRAVRVGACEICWTVSWAPCPEGTPNAVHNPQSKREPWMICQMCAATEQLRTVRDAEPLRGAEHFEWQWRGETMGCIKTCVKFANAYTAQLQREITELRKERDALLKELGR